MPLRDDASQEMTVVDSSSGILFAVFDGLKRVICKVDWDALVDRATVDEIDETNIRATFDRHCAAIPAIASRNYDAGQGSLVMTTSQLTPLS
ncbi:DUF1488 family protein [Bradyrhizobium glycinis]|uniref:DUF1488 family protein n=1 Tax=Bradyrhizobium glycinis TaxID=2751812 RepID=UPI0018D91A4B|nr:DUF1488 family protein [Bradyrhizobium glycinis]MBH5372027.1 DUF1488 family protein [Bradyrhizobium glycinis]